jgi:predicted GNAT family acetyltransferase
MAGKFSAATLTTRLCHPERDQPMPSDRYDVIHNPAENRFEVHLEGEKALLKYYLSDVKIVFTHTGLQPKLSGRSVGGRLV